MEKLKTTIKKFLLTEYNAEPEDNEDLFDAGILDSFDAIAYFSFLTEVSGCPLKI
jgi:acyl carrier protein